MNISLDSLDRQRDATLARPDRLDEVLDGLAASDDVGLRPLKVYAVVMRGVDEADVVQLAEFCLARAYRLRFIEQMPIGPSTAGTGPRWCAGGGDPRAAARALQPLPR